MKALLRSPCEKVDVLTMNETALRAQQIVRNPTKGSSRKRYECNERKYEHLLNEAGTNIDTPDFSDTRDLDKNKDPVVLACALILQRCGPTSKGYEGLKAKSTGGAVKSAVVNFWRKRGVNGEFFALPMGGYTGNPGKSPDLQSLIRSLEIAQRTCRSNLTTRAYQQTHEDLRLLYYRCIEPQLARAIRRDPTVNYGYLQAACVNLMQFSAVARGAEILTLQVQDLVFTGQSSDCPVVGVLPITKSRKTSNTYFRFTKSVDVSTCGLSALLGWLCVLRSHGICQGSVFLQVRSNVLQGGTSLDGCTFGRTVRELGELSGIIGLSEHSARRGGAGYHYFVLRRDLLFMFRAFSWESVTEMLKYIGIEDVHNSYALLGFTAFGTNELHFPMTLSG